MLGVDRDGGVGYIVDCGLGFFLMRGVEGLELVVGDLGDVSLARYLYRESDSRV